MSLQPDSYVVMGKLSQGGFSTTFLAKNVGNLNVPELVVLKQIKIPHENENVRGEVRDLNYIKDLEKEADTLKKLKHDCIPQYYGNFAEEGYFYIIQEYIQGESLDQVIGEKPLEEEKVISKIKEILNILQFIHSKGIIHRDIKPANLIIRESDKKLVLIDFGAVKEIPTKQQISSGITETRSIGTTAYMPSEQHQGNPRFSSDIYAVGIIAVEMLTGKRISEFDRCDAGNFQWQQDAIYVSKKLKDIISKMIEYLPVNRFKSAVEVLEALDKLAKNDSWQPLTKITLTVSLLLPLGWIVGKLLAPVMISWLNPACDYKVGDYISCGEEILYPYSKGIDRIKAAKYYAQKDYNQALSYFKKSWQTERKEAETLIYMNNALLEASGADYYTLAVAFPLSYKGVKAVNYELSQKLLRGVAQAQTEVNQNLVTVNQGNKSTLPGESFLDTKLIERQGTKGLKIVIVDDRNSVEHTEKIARKIAKKPKILGVIGHYASKITLADVDIYEKYNLAQVSPSSTTFDLTENIRNNFFRVVHTNIEDAQVLVDGIKKLDIKKLKIAVFYNPNSEYSKKLWDQIRQRLNQQNIKLIKNIGDNNFSTKLALIEAKENNANMFILLPDGQVSNALVKAIEILEADNGNTVMFGGNPLVNPKIEQIETSKPLRLIVSSAWHRLSDRGVNQDFVEDSHKLWEKDLSINGREVLAYDATLALIEAIKLQPRPTRKGTIAELSTPGFSFIGASGKVQFNTPKNGDRLNFAPILLRLFPCKHENVFVPMAIAGREAREKACKN